MPRGACEGLLTSRADYRRFRQQWAVAHAADGEFQGGVPFPSDRFELPSPEIAWQQGRSELAGNSSYGGLSTVPEPHDNGETEDDTP